MGKPFNLGDRDIRRDLVAPRIRETRKCKSFTRQESRNEREKKMCL